MSNAKVGVTEKV